MAPFQIERKTPGLDHPHKTFRGAAALELRTRLHPASNPRKTLVTGVLSPSLRAHI